MATNDKNIDNVLVIGSGIGGIKAALELAEMGFHVYLQDKAPVIGGTFLQLDKQFPTDDCGMCKILPTYGSDMSSECCVRRGLEHINITPLTNSNVTKLEGTVGKFKVTVAKNPEQVNPQKCIECGKCIDVCPVDVANGFNEELGTRKAIYLACPTASLGTYIIDMENCTGCNECVKTCPTDAIDLSAREVTEQFEVGAVVLAPGFELFDAGTKKEYGYTDFPNVVTSIEFERIFSGIGPYSDIREFVRPSDKKVPKKIGFIQCVGSRDQAIGKDYCSSACCMITLKEAMMFKELYHDSEVNIYFMDLRAFGKGYHRYYERARELGVNFVRNRPAAVGRIGDSNNLEIIYVTEAGEPQKDELEMVVLAVGLGPPEYNKELSKVFEIELDELGFCKTRDFSRLETSRDGIFVCGGFSGPKDIPDTVTEAIGAAGKISEVLGRPGFKPVIIEPREETPELDSEKPVGSEPPPDEEPCIGIFICDCGGEIGGVLDLDEIVNSLKTLPDIAVAEVVDYLCIDPEVLRSKLYGSGVNRVILGACAAYNYAPKFRNILLSSGLNPALLELVNLREQCAWSHRDAPEQATARARGQLGMAAEQLRDRDHPEIGVEGLNDKILVLGGGIAGLTAALTAAKAGVNVELVERDSELGGNSRNIYHTLDGKDVRELLRTVITEVEENGNITLHLNSDLKMLSGFLGNFKSVIGPVGSGEEPQELQIEHGALILATGAIEYEPKEFLYGKDKRVLTQFELEEILGKDEGRRTREERRYPKLVPRLSSLVSRLSSINTVVMIQCVGSRNREHPYCSRVCCSKALKNALSIKETDPETKIYILYQDIMSYGLMEKYYTLAREKGIEFIRYEPDGLPKVSIDKKDNIEVDIKDLLIEQNITLKPDLVVLSTGIVPDNKYMAEELVGQPLTRDGFFEEANVKFRPVDFLNDGIFVCGLAHSPRLIEESMAQAAAAVGRALALLSRPEAESRRKVSEVIGRFCAGCEACVAACPYGARILDPAEKIVKVLEPLCQGCGTCVAVCPGGAAKLRGYKDLQILNMIDAALEN